MKATKIDWCDCTLNPVVGCKNGCKYCYARKINDRFHFVDNWNVPQFFAERLKQLNSKKSKSIFMNSMSDLMHWKDEWFEKTFDAMLENKQHKYIFLTKSLSLHIPEKPNNVFLGCTIDTQARADRCWISMYDFLSIEPILESIILDEKKLYIQTDKGIENTCCKQIIIGAETGNRKDRVVPQKEWVENIVKQCDKSNIKVFMKSSLKEIMGNDFRQDKLIWEE